MDPALAVEYIDTPLFEGPIMDTMLEPTMPTNACRIYDPPEERAYEWIEDRWVDASEADRLRQQLARQKKPSTPGFDCMPALCAFHAAACGERLLVQR